MWQNASAKSEALNLDIQHKIKDNFQITEHLTMGSDRFKHLILKLDSFKDPIWGHGRGKHPILGQDNSKNHILRLG